MPETERNGSKEALHGGNNPTLSPDVSPNLVKTFGMGVIDQSGMSGAGKEDPILGHYGQHFNPSW